MEIKLMTSAMIFQDGIRLLQDNINIKEGNGIEIEAQKQDDFVGIDFSLGRCKIYYNQDVEFFWGLFQLYKNYEKGEFQLRQTPLFTENGAMFDNSHNAVMNIKTIKKYLCYMALMGQNMFYLYMQDTYEIEEFPRFGYMRSRFTSAEMKEIDDYAFNLGIKVIPCIQTLAHLYSLLPWKEFNEYTDIDDILLVGDPRTYKLIECMINACRKNFRTDTIHIGMDEAWHLGRGKYKDKNGDAPVFDLFCTHLEKVISICQNYGYADIMMWGDMFFHMTCGEYLNVNNSKFDYSLLEKIPQNVSLVYWDYYTLTKNDYDFLFDTFAKFGNNIIFAGGAWKWSGFAPSTKHSFDVTKLALNSAVEHNTKRVFTTAWGGSECSIYTILPIIAEHSRYHYFGDFNEDEISKDLEFLTGLGLNDFYNAQLPNQTPNHDNDPSKNPCKYLMYQDILAGLFDKHISEDYIEHYKKSAEILEKYIENKDLGNYFNMLFYLCKVLELKCDIAVNLQKAYKNNDKDTLKNIAVDKLTNLKKLVEEFQKAFRKHWYFENKTGGYDVHSIRVGGLIARINEAKIRLEEYLNGGIYNIEELEWDRMFFDCRDENSGGNLNAICDLWPRIISANVEFKC